MPCRVDPPLKMMTDAEYELMLKKLESESIKIEKEYNKRLKKEKQLYEKELKFGNIENMCFNSFMSVFLCKAMEILVSNFGYKYVNNDLEWWFKEHKYRDANNDKSSLSREEITKKMIEFSKKYIVN